MYKYKFTERRKYILMKKDYDVVYQAQLVLENYIKRRSLYNPQAKCAYKRRRKKLQASIIIPLIVLAVIFTT